MDSYEIIRKTVVLRRKPHGIQKRNRLSISIRNECWSLMLSASGCIHPSVVKPLILQTGSRGDWSPSQPTPAFCVKKIPRDGSKRRRPGALCGVLWTISRLSLLICLFHGESSGDSIRLALLQTVLCTSVWIIDAENRVEKREASRTARLTPPSDLSEPIEGSQVTCTPVNEVQHP